MPRYDYGCTKCSTEFELIHSISDCAKGRSCSDCGTALVRLIAAGQVVDTVGGFQMQAILGDGSRVDGQFGKEARRKGSPPLKL